MAQLLRLTGGPFDGVLVDGEPCAPSPAVLGFSVNGKAYYLTKRGKSQRQFTWRAHEPVPPVEVNGDPRFCTLAYGNTGRADADGVAEYQFSHMSTHGF